MRILLSSMLLLMVGCASYPVKNGFEATAIIEKYSTNPYFSDSEKDYVYKATIEAFDQNFGGIIAVRKLGNAHHRLVFTTEIGNTIFDFTFKEDAFVVNKIFEDLDRNVLINILRRDFFTLLLEKPKIDEKFIKEAKTFERASVLNKKHYYLHDEGRLKKIIRTKNEKEKVVFSFSEINDDIAKRIEIHHQNIKLKITLKAI